MMVTMMMTMMMKRTVRAAETRGWLAAVWDNPRSIFFLSDNHQDGDFKLEELGMEAQASPITC